MRTRAIDIFWWYWYLGDKSRYIFIAENASWLLKPYHWFRFHFTYRIARAKHYKLPRDSKLVFPVIAIASIVPESMIPSVFAIAGIIAPPTSFGAPVVMPEKVTGESVTTYSTLFQEIVTKNVGKRIMLKAAGGKPYTVNTFINLPAETYLYGENQENTEVIREGNGDLFRLGGACTITDLYVRASAKQASGAAFDFSHFNASNCRIRNIKLGNFFFNGFFIVAEKAGSFGVVFIRDIEFQEPGTRVKEYGNAGFVIGGLKKEEKRTIGVWLTDIYVGVNAVGDMGKAFQIQNTDSIHMKAILIQNASIGVRFGQEDESPLLTTNTFMNNVQCDGCTKGFFLANLNERHEWYGLSAEACTEGGFEQQGLVGGVVISGGTSSVNKNGFCIKTSAAASTSSNTCIGMNFCNNTEAGILFEASTGNWTFTGGVIGNVEFGGGTKKQAFGFFTLAKPSHIHFKAVEFVKGPGAGEEQTNYTVGIEPTDVDTEAQAKEHGCVFR